MYTPEEYPTPLEVQDEIIGIDNLKSKEVDEYVAYIQTKSAGDEVNVRVIRNKKEKIVKAKIYEEDGRKLMGVYLHSIVEYKTDPKVEIKYKRKESGPSAGMMSTLEMYNQLIKEDLTHGLKIAGTGTINYDGSVGEIGGAAVQGRGTAIEIARIDAQCHAVLEVALHPLAIHNIHMLRQQCNGLLPACLAKGRQFAVIDARARLACCHIHKGRPKQQIGLRHIRGNDLDGVVRRRMNCLCKLEAREIVVDEALLAGGIV